MRENFIWREFYLAIFYDSPNRQIKVLAKFSGYTVTTNRDMYLVHISATWTAENCFYLLEFRKCRKQCDVKTENALHIHLNDRTSGIRVKKTEKLVSQHFNLPGHSMGMTSQSCSLKRFEERTSSHREAESF